MVRKSQFKVTQAAPSPLKWVSELMRGEKRGQLDEFRGAPKPLTVVKWEGGRAQQTCTGAQISLGGPGGYNGSRVGRQIGKLSRGKNTVSSFLLWLPGDASS